MKKKNLALIFILAGIPGLAFAQTINNLMVTIVDLLRLFITLSSALAFGAFFWGIASFVFNVNEDKKREEGKNWMKWSVVALFVLATVWGILGFLAGTFNVSPMPILPLGK